MRVVTQDHYERPRQRSVLAMTSALDALHRVFGLQVRAPGQGSMPWRRAARKRPQPLTALQRGVTYVARASHLRPQVQPLAAARSLGMGLINAVPPVKNQLMLFAMGSAAAAAPAP